MNSHSVRYHSGSVWNDCYDIELADHSTLPQMASLGFDSKIRPSRIEQFNDRVSSPGEGRPFNECSHSLCDCSFNSSEFTYVTKSYSGTYHYFDLHHRTAAVLTNVSVPDISWGPIVSDLGMLVRDRLSSGSLLGVTIKEFGETLRMVRNPFGLLRKDWRKVVGQLTAKQLATRSANLWLEYQYGWRASYNDLKAFSKAAARCVNTFNNWSATQALESRFSKRQESVVSPPHSNTVWVNGASDEYMAAHWGDGNMGDYFLGGIKVLPRKLIAIVGCKRAMEADNFKNRLNYVFTQLGTAADQVLPTLWEIVPYSFVIDWFVNVGSMLNLPLALATLCSAKCHDLGYSVKCVTPFNLFVRPSNYWCPDVLQMESRSVVSEDSTVGHHTSYVRCAGLPQISFTDFCGTDLSISQLVSGAGLIIQRLFRH